MEYWFISDCHFGHAKILDYCNRPFKSIGEMDFRIVQNWNSRVKPEDVVFHIGDFCFKALKDKDAQYYINQLNGKIIFIRGNHDSNNGVKTCIEDVRIYLGGKHLLLIHNPEESCYGFDLVLAGHIHNHWLCKTLKFKKYEWDVFNVGVDLNDFRPLSINEILEKYKKWKDEQAK